MDRETQIRAKLQKKKRLLKRAVDEVRSCLEDSAADLLYELFPDLDDDEEGMDIMEQILLENLK